MAVPEATIWRLRHLIYQAFAGAGHPPDLAQMATTLHLSEDETLEALRTLGDMHSVFLTGDGRGVLMANPFSAVPTPFRVSANGVDYWANCAWDMLGVPAALGGEATIHATYAADDTTTELQVIDGHVEGAPGIVHFQQPFRAWYDDLPHT
ncbi:MAG: hypothetical protein H0U38_00690 [Chloroflexia bacterium]|jgi:hypothetical protein|nr:hypothetical protein [Chloroflexia bacterium]MDQ3614805.1 alkylmercury lyase family protein [Chloroflexota bacterium]